MKYKLCRICMKQKKANIGFVKIFESTELGDLVANIIIDFANVNVESSDGLPHIICTQCLDFLIKCREFQKLVVQNDRTLALLAEKSPEEIEKLIAEPLVRIEKVKKADIADSNIVILGPPVELIDDEEDKETETMITNQIDSETSESDSSEDEDDFSIEEEVTVNEDQPRFMCCCCPLQFNEEHEVMHHMNTDHLEIRSRLNIPPFGKDPRDVKQCEMCLKYIVGLSKLLDHQAQFKNSRQCVQCGELYRTGKLDCQCKKSVEPAPKPVAKKRFFEKSRCDLCDKLVANVNAHKANQHSTELLTCTKCDFTTYHKVKMIRHVKNSHVEKKYPCPVAGCDRLFASSNCSILKRHIERHNGEKRYICKFCSKAFSDSSDCHRHQWQHTGISPYMCSKCNKMFLRKNHVVAHEEKCAK